MISRRRSPRCSGAASSLRDLASGLTDREARSARHGDRRVRAAQPLRRQSARHDPAGIGAVEPNLALHDVAEIGRQRAAASDQDPGTAPRRARLRRRSADAAARRGAVRAGAVQSPGQCGEIFARRHHHHDAELSRRRTVCARGRRRGRRDSGRRGRERIRQVLSRASPITSVRGRALDLRSPAASSRRCMGGFLRRTAGIAAARC